VSPGKGDGAGEADGEDTQGCVGKARQCKTP
jgi:hypothetical protein